MADRGDRLLSRKGWRHPVLLSCVALYAVFRLLLWQWPHQMPLAVRYYLADLLCLPIVLSVVLLLQRHVVLRSPGYRLNRWQVLFAVVYFSVLFELVFPHFYPRYTTDYLDAAAYAAGGLLYWRFIHPGI